ncbi:MAG: phosphopantetheine-binding protein [Candidatus Sulfotelmatobacter sp.]
MREDVENWLKNWFRGRGKMGQGAVQSTDVDYFEAGWLTSMEVVEFVTEIEAQFDMQFSEQDLQDPRFVTISGLTGLISERSTQSSESK